MIMSAYTSHEHLEERYEKSVNLLNSTQDQLSLTTDILKKSVASLVSSLPASDRKLNNILADIKTAANSRVIDLDTLDYRLDELGYLMCSNSYSSTHGDDVLSLCLKKAIEDIECGKPCITAINRLTEKNHSNRKLSQKIIKVIDKLLIDKGKINKTVDAFISDVSDLTGTQQTETNNRIAALQQVTGDLESYICRIKPACQSEMDASERPTRSNRLTLISLLDQLQLPDEQRQKRIDLLKTLNQASYDNNNGLLEETAALINLSVASLQSTNHDLHEFIEKITGQLSEIRTYLELTQKDNIESHNRSQDMERSVIESVGKIKEKVSTAGNLSELKDYISGQLNEIREKVEEVQRTEKLKEEMSAQGISHIINELNATQREKSRLKKELKESKTRLLIDPLTGLGNRLAYEERVVLENNRRMRLNTPLSVAMWDIDYFKKINDSYGHDAGDRVLKIFSETIQARIRKTDLFARLGGEEFALLMPDTSIEMALSLNNHLREMLQNCGFNYNDEKFTVTASVGVAEFNNEDAPEVVLKRADRALYLSKNNGRNRCTGFNDEMTTNPM